MLAVLLLGLLSVTLCVADGGATTIFNLDDTCLDLKADLDVLYADTVTLAESCDDDYNMLLDEGGIDLNDAEENANVAWNARHAWGVEDLVAWRDRDRNRNGAKRTKRTYRYLSPDRKKLQEAQTYLERTRQRLAGQTSQGKVNLLCSQDPFKPVVGFAVLIDERKPSVLTMLGACEQSFCSPLRMNVC